jgi:hypothetical protein
MYITYESTLQNVWNVLECISDAISASQNVCNFVSYVNSDPCWRNYLCSQYQMRKGVWFSQYQYQLILVDWVIEFSLSKCKHLARTIKISEYTFPEVILFVCFWDRILLYSPDWPLIQNPSASFSWVLGLKTCANTLSFPIFNMKFLMMILGIIE